MGMLEGKVVAVTGAGRGVGREIALQLKAKGARLKAFILGHYTWSATVQVMLRRFTQLLRSGSMKD